MQESAHSAAPADWLADTGNGVKEFFIGLFNRDEFGPALLMRSFTDTRGWTELVVMLVLLAGTYFASRMITRRVPPVGGKMPLTRHLLRRLSWPILMLLAAVVGMFVWQYLSTWPSLWLRLLAMAARWMILIRVALAVLNSALPTNRFTDRLEYSMAAVLWVGFVLWISGLDDIIIGWLKSLQFTVGSSKLNLYTILTGLLWVGIMMVGALWLARYIDGRLKNSTRLDANLQIVLSKIATTLLVFLSILIALPLVGIDLTVLSVFGGALGVGLGFGLQKIASNYVSGFIILGDRSIRPGDRLTVDNFTGYVTNITARFVVLRSVGGQEALIPNETFVTSTVINESYSGKTLWQSLDVQVAYHTDLTLALRIMEEAAAAQERVQKDPAPNAVLVNFGDNGIDLKVGFWVKDPENGFLGLFSAILLTIWRRFNEEGIEFPFPQREVRILNDDPQPDASALTKAGYLEQADTVSSENGHPQ